MVKEITIPELVTLLNKESFGEKRYKVQYVENYEWQTDFLQTYSSYDLYQDKTRIAVIEMSFRSFDQHDPKQHPKIGRLYITTECTWGDMQLLTDITGMPINSSGQLILDAGQ